MVKNRAAYQRGYNKAWKQARRARLVEMLGGKCVRCGATEDLEFDHIDPSTKVFAVCAGLTRAWDALVEEASKTQLLCKPCHVIKGAEDRPELKHGTYYVYWYWNCRCQDCKAANARKSAALRAKRLPSAPELTGEPNSQLVAHLNREFSVGRPPNKGASDHVNAGQRPIRLPR